MGLIGQNIGRYHIVEQIGEGGMAAVYKAFDTHLERDVAIKIIRKEVFSPNMLERVMQRFEREGKALAKLSYPNIVHIYDYGVIDDSPYLVMEFVENGTLKAKMGKPIPWKESIQLVIPIAKALSYAHQRGIIHRDVKPSNILLNCDGLPLLTDFGVAKLLEGDKGHTLTGTGVGIGTAEYMAPEQGLGAKDVDNRADIYSLGIVLYELLTGQKPYTAETPMAVVVMQARDPLPDPRQFVPDLPEAVERILFKSLAKNPDDRYKHASVMIAALEELFKTTHINDSKNTKQTSLNTQVEYLSSNAVYVSEIPTPLNDPASNQQPGSETPIGTEEIQETQAIFDVIEDQNTPATQVTFDELEKPETSDTADKDKKENPDQPNDQNLTSATNSSDKRKFISRKELWELAVVICVLIIVMGVISGIWLLINKTSIVTVNSRDGWVSSGMHISSGQLLSISYVSGSWSVCNALECGGSLDGNGSNAMGGGAYFSLYYPSNIILGCLHGALIARIGDGEPFCVNNNYDATRYSNGEIFFSINDAVIVIISARSRLRLVFSNDIKVKIQ